MLTLITDTGRLLFASSVAMSRVIAENKTPGDHIMRHQISTALFLENFQYVQCLDKEKKSFLGSFFLSFKDATLTAALRQLASTLNETLCNLNREQSPTLYNNAFYDAIEKALNDACAARWESYKKKNPKEATDFKFYLSHQGNTDNIFIPLDKGRFEKHIIAGLTAAKALLMHQLKQEKNYQPDVADFDIGKLKALIGRAKNPSTSPLTQFIMNNHRSESQAFDI